MKPDLSGVSTLEMNLATRASVGDALTRAATMFPARTAVVDGNEMPSYLELDRASCAIGHALLAGNIEQQEPVALLMRNSWRMLATYFGCAKAGLVAMPLNIALDAGSIAWVLTDSGTRNIVVDTAILALLEPYLEDAADGLRLIGVGEDPPDAVGGYPLERWDALVATAPGTPVETIVEDRDSVQCLYTSGTTSNPKGVLTSHLAVLIGGMTNAMQIGHNWGDDPSTLLCALPLFHTTALNTLALPVLFTGGTVVVHAQFDPQAVVTDIAQHAVTHFMGLPMMYRAMIMARGDAGPLPGVRTAIYAMAPMPTNLLDQVAALFPSAKVILGSGQTEVVPATVLQWPAHQFSKPDSWGPSVPTVQTAIMGSDGRLLPPGEVGEIVYRGPHVASGYWNNSQANTSAFAHGWFHSGDIGHVDEQQVVWFSDRLKDIIKTGGENVSSVDVERVVTTAPGVAEGTVIGVPHERWGEAVCAVVVPVEPEDAGNLPEQVLTYCKAHLAGFQVPKRVVLVEALPKTATGKIRKHIVRQTLLKDTAG